MVSQVFCVSSGGIVCLIEPQIMIRYEQTVQVQQAITVSGSISLNDQLILTLQ